MPETGDERRRRELAAAARRMSQVISPDVKRMLAEATRNLMPQQRLLAEVAKHFTSAHADMVKNFALNQRPLVNSPRLKIDYKSLFPDLTDINRGLLDRMEPALVAIRDVQRQQFVDLFVGVREALDASLPPNWRGDDIDLPADIETLLLDEGLPLAWVPPKRILKRLFAAKSGAERRGIIGRSWRPITNAACAELSSVVDPSMADHVAFAQDAAASLLSDQSHASQALSANLLDTILRTEFSEKDRKTITGRKRRLDIDDYPLRVAIVLGGIWGAHGEFRPDSAERIVIPTAFSRHASAHGVSRRQYSRINATLALMHVTGLLKTLEVDFR